MKKVCVVMLVMLMGMMLCACGASSAVSIDSLEKAFQDQNEDLVFTVVEEESGYSFEYTEDGWVTSISYQGTANRKSMVESVTIVNQNVNIQLLTNASKLTDAVTKRPGDMTVNDLRVAYCVAEVTKLYTLMSGEAEDMDVTELLGVFISGDVIETNGWVIKATTDADANLCTITAEYR
ncbi:MAG: hypothetical protein IJO10_07380 [Clostridia bacterium]|nr:hypothetical protein [Clostridia bacterium]